MVVTRDAVAAHRIFVVETVHAVEVRSDNEAHLVQWLSKRLGRPLELPILKAHGFSLIGGRLLPAGSDAAAMLMYDDDRGIRLTVYIRAGTTGETAFQFWKEGNLATLAWLDQGYGFAVSAAVDRGRLLPIAEAVYRTLDSGSTLLPNGGGS
jgi:anti-sigma factor RsiW